MKISGSVNVANADQLINKILSSLKKRPCTLLCVDLKEAESFDDYGIIFFAELKRLVAGKHGDFTLVNIPEQIQKLLDLYPLERFGSQKKLSRHKNQGLIVRLGAATLNGADDIGSMISFVGAVCVGCCKAICNPKTIRKDDTLHYMQKCGVEALPIVGLISFLLGLIIAFMSSVQLKQFGANIYVASLVGLGMTRELGPIMTAIIVAGRSGSAFAAEIGTMQVSEEVDALVTMGFEPTQFLVMPKLIAAVLMVPLLTLFADVFSILGGMIVGIGMLDLTSNAYIDQTLKTLTLFDVFFGVGKAAVFALLIAWIGCLRGFQVKGGAAGVGQATTSAVVSSLFLIIITDAVFAVILRYW